MIPCESVWLSRRQTPTRFAALGFRLHVGGLCYARLQGRLSSVRKAALTEPSESSRAKPPALGVDERPIYEGLARIAPAAAQMFMDACALVADACALRSRQHLVAHLLREIDSTLMAMLDPGEPEKKECPEKDGEAQRRDRITLSLGLDETEPWLLALKQRGQHYKLHGWAHRSGVDVLREDEGDFVRLWDIHLDIFRALLDLFDRRAALIQKQVESLTGVPPSKTAAKEMANRIPRDPISLNQLFGRCSDPAWLPQLRWAGFFKSAPGAVFDAEHNGFRFPGWPAGEYLGRLAMEPAAAPEVTEILEQLPASDNPYAYQSIVTTAITLPVELGVRLVPQVLTGVRMRGHLPRGTDVAEFSAHLAEEGHLGTAYELADELLRLQTEEGPLARRAASSFGDWEFSEVCKKLAPTLVAANPLRAYEFASNRLEESLALSAPDRLPGWDMSEYWRPSLTDESERERDPRSALVDFTRHALDAAVSASALSIDDAVADLRERGSLIFDRLALCILAAHPTLNLDLAARVAFEEEADEDRRTLNEVARLQAAVFPLVPDSTASCFLERVDGGPGPDLDDWRERFQAAKEVEPTEADTAEYVAWWKTTRLFPVLEHLDATRRAEYDALVSLLKKPPRWDDYQIFRVRSFWGDKPPVDENVIAGMTTDELADYLRTWEPPSDNFDGPTIRGMARQLQSVVEKDPEKFACRAEHFLDLRQEYVDALIHGLTQALRAGGAFSWEPVLDFLRACTVDHRYLNTGTERDEGDETLGASANLLETGLTSSANRIPDGHLDDVWRILAPVFTDPNPTLEHEQKYGGSNMDPFALSLNTVRGKATHALIALLVEKARAAGEFDLPLSGRRGISRWPELESTLDRCLDVSREPSLTVRAAIGAHLDLLALIDPEWFEEHRTVLFPVSHQEHREVVFDAYLLWGTIREPLIPLFRDEYLYRTGRLSEPPAVTWERREPQEALARHVVAMYLHGDIELDDELMRAVYCEANQTLWSAATARVYLGLGKHKDPPEPTDSEYVARSVRLWEWRIRLAEDAASAGDATEFRPELEDFSHWVISGEFDEKWWIDQLERVTDVIGHVELDGPVLDAVASAAERHPLPAVRVATELLIHDPWAFLASAHGDAFMSVVTAAVSSDVPEAVRGGRDLANRLVGKGHHEFGPFAIG